MRPPLASCHSHTLCSSSSSTMIKKSLDKCCFALQAGSKNIPSSGCDSGKHCDTRKLPRTSYRSSSSVIGCEASYLGYGLEDNVILEEPQEQQLEQQSQQGQKAAASSASGGRLEAHSCPSSPTETDCSSGFSTLRRRSVTLTEKVSEHRKAKKESMVLNQRSNSVRRPRSSSSTM